MRVDGAVHYTCEVKDLETGKMLADRIAAMIEHTYQALDGKSTKIKIKGAFTEAVADQ